MSRFFKPLYVMIVFISLFFVVRDVKAGLAHFCNEYNPCPEHLCMPDMKVVCTAEELCLCIKLI